MKNDLTFTSISLDEQLTIFGGATAGPGGFSISFEKKTTKTSTTYILIVNW